MKVEESGFWDFSKNKEEKESVWSRSNKSVKTAENEVGD